MRPTVAYASGSGLRLRTHSTKRSMTGVWSPASRASRKKGSKLNDDEQTTAAADAILGR